MSTDHGDIGELVALMATSRQHYEMYLSDGKTFRHAKALRQNNQQIMDFLSAAKLDTDPELGSALRDLAAHLQDWALCWDREQAAKTPGDGDPFVFTGYKTYPKHLDPLLQAHLRTTDRR